MQTARIIAKAQENAREMWKAEDQVANRLREIMNLAYGAQDSLEWGALAEVSRKLKGIRFLCRAAMELQARRGR